MISSVHDFRGFRLWSLGPKPYGRTPWWQEYVVEERSLCCSEQKVNILDRKGARARCPQGSNPSDSPLDRPCLSGQCHQLVAKQSVQHEPVGMANSSQSRLLFLLI